MLRTLCLVQSDTGALGCQALQCRLVQSRDVRRRADTQVKQTSTTPGAYGHGRLYIHCASMVFPEYEVKLVLDNICFSASPHGLARRTTLASSYQVRKATGECVGLVRSLRVCNSTPSLRLYFTVVCNLKDAASRSTGS